MVYQRYIIVKRGTEQISHPPSRPHLSSRVKSLPATRLGRLKARHHHRCRRHNLRQRQSGGVGGSRVEPFVVCLFSQHNCHGGEWNDKTLLITHTRVQIEARETSSRGRPRNLVSESQEYPRICHVYTMYYILRQMIYHVSYPWICHAYTWSIYVVYPWIHHVYTLHWISMVYSCIYHVYSMYIASAKWGVHILHIPF